MPESRAELLELPDLFFYVPDLSDCAVTDAGTTGIGGGAQGQEFSNLFQ
jgi:hypothetical protein